MMYSLSREALCATFSRSRLQLSRFRLTIIISYPTWLMTLSGKINLSQTLTTVLV